MTAHLTAAQARPPAAIPDRQPRGDLRTLLATPGSRTVLLDGSRDPNAGFAMFLIPAGDDQPRLMVKLATSPAAADEIRQEAALLAELQRRPMRRVEATLPRPAGAFEIDGMLACATSVVPGVPMRTRYHAYRHLGRPGRVRADFAAASGWLADLHADTVAEAAPISLLDGVPELITARWPWDPRAGMLADKLGPVAARLASGRIPRTVVHGDFWAGNLLLTGDAVTGVVDWPGGRLSGEPLSDVARFALSYALYLDRHTRPGHAVAGHRGLRATEWGAGVRYAIAGGEWFGEVVRDFVGSALARLGAPAGLWRDVLLAGLAEVAATADHADFAARHRDLLLSLVSEVRP
jgi:Phosphotransferase enzyme family